MNDVPPTLLQELIFRAKALILGSLRTLRNLFDRRVHRWPVSKAFVDWSELTLLSESRSPLWSADASPAEKVLQAGKVQNLRKACLAFHQVPVPPKGVLSFWAQVGKPSRGRGYVVGRELRQGCLIPSVGGGLCQLSNALYDAALKAGLVPLERHAHTQIVPGSMAEAGRDATVFWNYVDLRLASDSPFVVRAMLTDQELVIGFYGEASAVHEKSIVSPQSEIPSTRVPNSCASCGVLDCIHNVETSIDVRKFGRTAYLVDEFWPEFDAYIGSQDRQEATLFLPLDGKRWKKAQYAWSIEGFRKVRRHTLFTIVRSLKSRKLSNQGAARQKELLKQDFRLAERMNRNLTPDFTHLVVSQTLLPHLNALGALGGRTVDVLLTRAPIAALQRALDFAARRHPESTTLADFRAPVSLMITEEEALARVAHFITPHREMATLFGDRAVLIDWNPPRRVQPQPTTDSSTLTKIGFLGPTVGRKGAHLVREAIRRLANLPIEWVVLGPLIEGPDFWSGLPVTHRATSVDSWKDLPVLVAPSYVENAPRHLLAALASGRKVIASTACGLPEREGLFLIEAGDLEGFCRTIERIVHLNDLDVLEKGS